MHVTPSLIEQAKRVMFLNDRHQHTVPSAHLYPHLWAWDSAFAAIGWGHLDLNRAVTELETLLAGMWEDGRVPHIQFNENVTETYFPDASFWQAGSSSSITQPPVWAIAARKLYSLDASKERLKALATAIEKTHLFFQKERDPLSWGLVSVAHPWESGLDNCPAWDLAMEAVDPLRAPPFKRVDKAKVADPSMRPTDDEYKRYATLVKDITEDNFGHGPFQVYCPLMTAILARAEEDLAWLAKELNIHSAAKERLDRIYTGLKTHLYDEKLGRYCYYDIKSKTHYSPEVIGAYGPLMLKHASIPTKRLLPSLKQMFNTPYLFPTTAPSHPRFDPKCYWRGPIWVNINWLFETALGEVLPIREQTISLIEKEGFYEYYHPLTGKGLGAKDFTWTAALCLDWLLS